MLAKRREYDRQLEWEEEYSRRRDMEYLEDERRRMERFRERNDDKMMIEDKFDYFNSYPPSRLDNRWCFPL